jgi:hypothetical protein
MMAATPSRRANAAANANAAPSSSSSSSPALLVIGATGVTGRAALDGMLAAGVPPSSILALTRSAAGQGARAVADRGVALAEGDLDSAGGGEGERGGNGGEGDVARLLARYPSLRAVYVHALSADAATADPRELERARSLAAQLSAACKVEEGGGGGGGEGEGRGARRRLDLVLYNSSAGRGADAGISQMDQKHAAEDVLRQEEYPFLALQPAMFYEELWKRYTRPSVLTKGKFPFSVPPDVPVHLVAARDLGRAVAYALREPARYASMRALPLAGDALTPRQLCAAFERAAREWVKEQGQEQEARRAASPPSSSSSSPPATAAVATTVTQSRPPAWLFWLVNRDLYRIVRFLSTPPGYGVDVQRAREAVPGLLSFDAFLRATRWADPSRSYEDGGVRYDSNSGGEGGEEGNLVAARAMMGHERAAAE